MTTDRKQGLQRSAHDYLQRGWSILPIGADKQPVIKWKPYQSEHPSRDDVTAWLKNPGLCGWGVVGGRISGDLVCRDFDDPAAYDRWVKSCPGLAKQLPTVKTHRGYHIWFRCEDLKTRRFSDGEYRGKGSYTTLPPSIHPKGDVYKWLIPLPEGDLPLVPCPVEAGLVGVEVTESDETVESAYYIKEVRNRVVDAISRTLPPRPGTRNPYLFKFVRELKAIPPLSSADPSDLMEYAYLWYQQALPHIHTKDWEETFSDFIRAWKGVKLAVGVSMKTLFQRAKENPVEDSRFKTEEMKVLAGWCRELQGTNRDAPFYLSCRTVAELFDVTSKTASFWLKNLVEGYKFMEIIDKGGLKTGKATRYRLRNKA